MVIKIPKAKRNKTDAYNERDIVHKHPPTHTHTETHGNYTDSIQVFQRVDIYGSAIKEGRDVTFTLYKESVVVGGGEFQMDEKRVVCGERIKKRERR